MSAHHGPPCGHTLLGTCVGCGGQAPAPPPNGWLTLTNATRTYGPVTVTAEAMAEAQRQIGALQRLREQNDALLWKWMVHPFAVQLKAEFKPEAYRGIDRSATPQKLSGAMLRDRDGDLYFGGIKITADPTLMPHEIRMVQAPPIDPLDVEYDGVKLRDLLDIDARRRDERNPFRKLSLAQRAAVSAHWSAELRAKVAAGAAADKARETSVVVDLEEP